jgi:selenocysteine-specific elongation factor
LGDEALLNAVLESMHEAGRIRLSEKGVAVVGRGPKMSQNERKLLPLLVEKYRQAGAQPPSVKRCQEEAPNNQQSVPQLLELAAANGQLVEISPQLYLHADVEREYRERLAAELAGGKALTLSEIREMLNTTRKYAVPYCEYLDRIGFTKRQGDLRVLAKPDPT